LQVTCAQVVVQSLEDAHEQIDFAISEALLKSKPCYIEISCNLAGIPAPSFTQTPVPYALSRKTSNPESLAAAVAAAAEVLNKAVKPVLVGGVKLRSPANQKAFAELAGASK
jgi:pyruvate decarboxylase